jgi:hypothetical protein
MEISSALVDRYLADGFLVVRGLFSADEMAEAAAEADHLFSRRDLIDTDNLRCRWQDHYQTGECRFDTFDPVIDLSPLMGRIAHDRRILDLLGELYGEEACLIKDKLIFKPPRAKGYALHQDFIGWDSFPESFVTVLVPIDAADEENGGLGQSALSVVSTAAVGKWFRRRMGIAMGVYSVLLTIGFIGGILWMGDAVKAQGWRGAWSELGCILLLAVAPISWLLQRNTPEECGQTLDEPVAIDAVNAGSEADYTLRQALATPAFWVFALETATFNLVWTGVTIFLRSSMRDRLVEPGCRLGDNTCDSSELTYGGGARQCVGRSAGDGGDLTHEQRCGR